MARKRLIQPAALDSAAGATSTPPVFQMIMWSLNSEDCNCNASPQWTAVQEMSVRCLMSPRETPPRGRSAAGEDAAAPSPKEMDDATVAGDSSRRRLPQSRSHVAPVTQPCAGSPASSAVVATVPESKPAPVAAQSLTLPEACKRFGHGHDGAAACGAFTRAPKKVPQWTCHMKKKDGQYVTCVRVTNPTALYDRGINGLRRASAKREAMRAKLEEAALAEATFRPTISPRVRALKRSGDSAGAAHDSSAQLRYRLQLLELPDEPAHAAHRHTPRLSHTSEMIVRACRGRRGAEPPPEERLYRDYFYRQQAIEEARLVTASPAVVRSKRHIDAHIAELYSFEQQRQRAIAAARDALLSASSEAHRRLCVDPRALVERLTKPRSPSQQRSAAAQLEKDPCPFHPQTSASSAELAHQARLRGLHRWVRYFCDADILSMAVLSTFQGQAAQEAATLSAVLRRHSPTKTEWSVEELADAFVNDAGDNSFIAELWRRRPPIGEASAALGELTHRPCLNPKSAMIVDKMNAEHRGGPTHDRLFLNARAKQLSQRQQELEEEQASLEDKQREQKRRQRLQAAWRAQEAQRLEAYRAEKAEERRKSAAAEASAAEERLHPCTTSCSRQLFMPSSSPQLRSGGRASVPPSASPRQSSAAATDAVILKPRSYTPSMPTASSTRPPEVSRVRGSNTDNTTTARNKGSGGNGRGSGCPSPAFHPTTTSAQAAPAAQCLTSSIPRNVEDWPVANKQELDRAAEALRDLLVDPARSCRASPQGSAASSQRSLSAATCFTPCDVNRPLDSQCKLHAPSLDVLLVCAQLRDSRAFPAGERERLDRAQKRQLRELGRLLYSRYIIQSTIVSRIQEAFQPAELEVTEVSAEDAKYNVRIVSAAFAGVPLIQRHRMVNDLFGEELRSGTIHALGISAKPPPS
ncbi:BolA-like family protein [Leishmania donovani]|uniref:BolA-like family protein n=1 Tax=Leishmania donovani TaxID=5661 RepID=A0A504XNM3_LEIDO|nr:BolA-like family protein [Leishmania donovani]